MNALDWILLALVALLAVRCFMRGVVEELLSVAAWVAGLLAAVLLYRPGAVFVRQRLGIATAPEVIAFAAIFLIAFLLVKILERLLHEGLEAARLDRLDQVLGLVLGAVEGLLAASIILIVLQVQPLFDVKALLAGSVFAKTILPIVGPEVTKALTPALKSVGPILPALKKP